MMLDNIFAYQERLVKRGFVKIGGGLFGTVYAKPSSDKVIKVGKDYDGWIEYIEWATSCGYSGKFAPLVYTLKFHQGFYVAVIERLVCTVREAEGSLKHIHAAVWSWSGYGQASHDGMGHEDLKAFCLAMSLKVRPDDLHDGNLMLRHDGQIVITDPVSRHRYNSTPVVIKDGIVCNDDTVLIRITLD